MFEVDMPPDDGRTGYRVQEWSDRIRCRLDRRAMHRMTSAVRSIRATALSFGADVLVRVIGGMGIAFALVSGLDMIAE